jgi:hypothetical protein
MMTDTGTNEQGAEMILRDIDGLGDAFARESFTGQVAAF